MKTEQRNEQDEVIAAMDFIKQLIKNKNNIEQNRTDYFIELSAALHYVGSKGQKSIKSLIEQLDNPSRNSLTDSLIIEQKLDNKEDLLSQFLPVLIKNANRTSKAEIQHKINNNLKNNPSLVAYLTKKEQKQQIKNNPSLLQYLTKKEQNDYIKDNPSLLTSLEEGVRYLIINANPSILRHARELRLTSLEEKLRYLIMTTNPSLLRYARELRNRREPNIAYWMDNSDKKKCASMNRKFYLYSQEKIKSMYHRPKAQSSKTCREYQAEIETRKTSIWGKGADKKETLINNELIRLDSCLLQYQKQEKKLHKSTFFLPPVEVKKETNLEEIRHYFDNLCRICCKERNNLARGEYSLKTASAQWLIKKVKKDPILREALGLPANDNAIRQRISRFYLEGPQAKIKESQMRAEVLSLSPRNQHINFDENPSLAKYADPQNRLTWTFVSDDNGTYINSKFYLYSRDRVKLKYDNNYKEYTDPLAKTWREYQKEIEENKVDMSDKQAKEKETLINNKLVSLNSCLLFAKERHELHGKPYSDDESDHPNIQLTEESNGKEINLLFDSISKVCYSSPLVDTAETRWLINKVKKDPTLQKALNLKDASDEEIKRRMARAFPKELLKKNEIIDNYKQNLGDIKSLDESTDEHKNRP